MIGIDQVEIAEAIVHKVGNPTRGEQLKLSEQSLVLADETVKQLLVKYFLHGFNTDEIFHFTHISNVELNEVFSYVKSLFKNPTDLTEVSKQLARFLYSKSTHVRVKEGELYVAVLNEVPFENDFVQAIGIFKSETKEAFLKLSEDKLHYNISAEDGININKLDKGCLVFKTNEAEGYAVCVLDNTNKAQDAQYWIMDFLQVQPVENEYHFTNEYLQVVRQFATQEMPENFDVTKGQQIDLMQRGLDYFKEKDRFNLDEFSESVIQYPQMMEQFATFKDNYAKSKSINFEDEFDIDLSAVKKQSRTFKSVLKLDKNFHVYIHGRRDLIERGFDESTGKYYYKIYFDQEA